MYRPEWSWPMRIIFIGLCALFMCVFFYTCANL